MTHSKTIGSSLSVATAPAVVAAIVVLPTVVIAGTVSAAPARLTVLSVGLVTAAAGTGIYGTAGGSVVRRRLGAGLVLGALVVASLVPRMRLVSGDRPDTALPSRSVVALRGRALQDLRPGASGWMHLPLRLERVCNRTGWSGSAGGRVTLLWEGSGYLIDGGGRSTLPVRGDTVVVSGLEGLPDDTEAILVVSREDLRIEARAGTTELRRSLRAFIRRRLARLPRDSRGLGEALLLGDRGDLPREFLTSMRRAGASHVMALSGMHLAILAGLLIAIVRRVVPARYRLIVVFPVLLGYVWIAGWIPSLLRALVLFAFAAAAQTGGRRVPAPVLLARTVLAIAAVSPPLTREIGFLLSVSALAGLMLWTDPIAQRLARTLPRPMAIYGAASAAAILGTGAISLALFGEIYPAGLLLAGVLSLGIVGVVWCLLGVVVLSQVPLVGTVVLSGFGLVTKILAIVAGLGDLIPSARGLPAVVVLVLIAVPVLPSPRRLRRRANEPRLDF